MLAGSSAGAMVLCDPMVDPRGGAFTLGLGLLANLAVIPAHNRWSEDAAHRTLKMSPAELALVGIDERTALIRDPDGTWRTAAPARSPSSKAAVRPTCHPYRADQASAPTRAAAGILLVSCALGRQVSQGESLDCRRHWFCL